MLSSEMDWVFDTRNGAENIEMSRRLTKRNPTPLNSGTHDDVVETKKIRNDDEKMGSLRALSSSLLLPLDIAEMVGGMEPALADLIPHYISKLPKYRSSGPDLASLEVRSSEYRHPGMNRTQWDSLWGA